MAARRISDLIHLTDDFVIKNPTKEERYGLGIRHLVGFLGFSAAFITYTQRFSLSITITEMTSSKHLTKVDPDACPMPPDQPKPHASSGEFDWDERIQGLVLSSFFWGYVITPLLGGWVGVRYGAKHVMATCIGVSTLMTVLSPIVARTIGWGGFLGLRFIMGLGQGPVYPMLSVMMSQWSPANERGRMASAMFAGAMMGNVVAMVVSGLVIGRFGWTGSFYLWSIVGVLWLITWYICFTNTPLDHPWISEKERQYIVQFSGRSIIKEGLPPTPWIAMLTSVPLWSLIIAQIGHDWGLFTVVVDLPKYLKSVLHFTLKQNAFISGMPYLVMWVFAIISGFLSDWMVGPKQMPVTLVRKIFISIASVGPAFGLIAASYSGCNRIMASFFFVFGMGTMGAFVPSLKVNPVDLSPNYAGIVMAFVNGIGALSGIATPYLVGYLAPNSFLMEWRLVFWICVTVLVITNIIYIIFGTAKAQPWNEPKKPE